MLPVIFTFTRTSITENLKGKQLRELLAKFLHANLSDLADRRYEFLQLHSANRLRYEVPKLILTNRPEQQSVRLTHELSAQLSELAGILQFSDRTAFCLAIHYATQHPHAIKLDLQTLLHADDQQPIFQPTLFNRLGR